MKFLKNIKKNNIRVIYLCNIPVYTDEIHGNIRMQTIFKGLIETETIKTKYKEEKNIKIFGLPIIKKIFENNIYKYYLFNFFINKIDAGKKFFNKYLKKIKLNYDDVYILNANSGEIYLFFAYLAKSFLTKNKSKNPLFITAKNYHTDILKLYFPDAKNIYIKDLNLRYTQDFWEKDGHKYYIIFSGKQLSNVEKAIKNNNGGTIHYFHKMTEALSLSENDFSKPEAIISNATKENLKNKFNNTDFNLQNFIIIAPEALTCTQLQHSFWEELCTELRKKGYDLFLNITNKNNFIEGCLSIALSYRELLWLSYKAKAVISLRSGLSEFLLQAQIPNISIYTKFQRKKEKIFPAEKAIAGFTMTKIPFTDKENIIELNADKFKNENELITEIINSLEILLNKKEIPV